ncbi:phosphatidylinositol-binding protein scs2 [Thoreauomyces humboldtii]|nr:phosphatidylinositol-binding protein scs2 [Thoreauomyces humboldtii]
MDSYLVVTPERELSFSPPFSQTVRRTLTITNGHPSSPIAFKIKTTAPRQYCVRPNSGRVAAGERAEVQVLLQATKDEPPLKSRDKFLVQGIKVPSDVMTLEGDDLTARLSDLWLQAETLKKASPDAASQILGEKKLRCVFVAEGATAADSDAARRLSSAHRSNADLKQEFTDADVGPSPRNSVLPLPAYDRGDVGGSKANAAPETTRPRSGSSANPTPTTVANAPSSVQPHPPAVAAPVPNLSVLSAELQIAKEKVKTLQQACEGYKEEIERLGALRQRQSTQQSGNAVEKGHSNGGSSVLSHVADDRLSLQIVGLLTAVAFFIGVLFF